MEDGEIGLIGRNAQLIVDWGQENEYVTVTTHFLKMVANIVKETKRKQRFVIRHHALAEVLHVLVITAKIIANP